MGTEEVEVVSGASFDFSPPALHTHTLISIKND